MHSEMSKLTSARHSSTHAVLIAIFFFSIAAEALADESISRPNWSGLYVGGQAGYAAGDADFSFGAPGFNSSDPNVEGFLGGVHIGYNAQAKDFVFGAVADVNFGDINGRNSNRVITGDIQTLTTDFNVSGSVRGKFGRVFGDRVLVYGTAGLAIADIDHRIRVVGPLTLTQSNSATHFGLTAGGGVEFAVTDGIFMFVEGRWTNYATEGFSPAAISAAHTFDFEHVQVLGGISFNLRDLLGTNP